MLFFFIAKVVEIFALSFCFLSFQNRYLKVRKKCSRIRAFLAQMLFVICPCFCYGMRFCFDIFMHIHMGMLRYTNNMV